jgi:hypothetical protein
VSIVFRVFFKIIVCLQLLLLLVVLLFFLLLMMCSPFRAAPFIHHCVPADSTSFLFFSFFPLFPSFFTLLLCSSIKVQRQEAPRFSDDNLGLLSWWEGT